MTNPCRFSLILLLAAMTPALYAQGTLADYQRAQDLQAKARDLVLNEPGPAHWIGDSHHFWYAHSVKGGAEYVLVDAEAPTKHVAFDHAKLADAVNKAAGGHYTAQTLPFQPGIGQRPGARRAMGGPPQTAPLIFVDDEKAIQFGEGGSMYKCDLQAYTCVKTGPIPSPGADRRGESPEADALSAEDVSPEGPGGDPADGLAWQPPASQEGDTGRFSRLQRACAGSHDRQGPRERVTPEPARMGVGSPFPGQLPPTAPETCKSFDGKWEAFIQDFNVFLKPDG